MTDLEAIYMYSLLAISFMGLVHMMANDAVSPRMTMVIGIFWPVIIAVSFVVSVCWVLYELCKALIKNEW